MSSNDRIVRQLVRFVRQQRAIKREQQTLNKILAKEARATRKLLGDHEQWMKDHEASLRLHDKLIAALGEKLH